MKSAILALLSVLAPALAMAAPPEDFFWEAGYETALARTAAPANISTAASIWLLTPEGYQRVQEGSNGFNCLVMRQWSAIFDIQRELFDWPELVAPICFDPEASHAPMQEQILRAKLGLMDRSHDEIKAAVFEAYAEGRLGRMPPVSFSYMYSGHQNLAPGVGAGNPHVMVYAPGYTNAMLGGNGMGSKDPIVFDSPGTPRAIAAIFVNARAGHIYMED